MGIRKDLIDIIYQEIPEQLSEIDRIISIGIKLEELVKKFINIKILKNNKISFQNFKFLDQNNKDFTNEIMLMGTIYIFELRNFLLKDEIYFSIGGLYEDKDTGNTVLAEKFLSQKEMLQSIRSSLSSKAVILQGHLENFKSQDIIQNSTLIQMWNQILNLTDISDFKYYKGISTKCLIPGKRTRFYQNPNADDSVWLRFVGKSHRIITYYLKSNGEVSFFNKGWLYEWFKSFVLTQQHINNLQNSLSKGSIEPIVQKMDSVAGYKGGDYSLGNQLGSVQAKYGNDQIISFTSILRVLFEINEILQLYKTQEPQDLEKMANQLFDLFTDKSTEESLSLGVNQTKEYILNILTKDLTN